MPCRGVFFAIAADQAKAFELMADDDAIIELIEEIEKTWDQDNLAECDKSWDAIHRLLTDGRLEYGNGPEPLCYCVLGPNQLYAGDDYIVSLVPPDKVKEVAIALSGITPCWFNDRYRTTVPHDYAPEYGDVDREYTWEWFLAIRELYQKAAERNRAMLFTVSQ